MSAQLAFHQLAQRLPPRQFVWRIDEHAVDVEDHTVEPALRACASGRPLASRRIAADQERHAVAAPELAHQVADANLDRCAVTVGQRGDRQPPAIQGDGDVRAAELHRQVQAIEPVDHHRIEREHVVTDLGTEVCALHEVQCPRHHAQVDAFLGRPSLHVADVALESDEEPLPGTLWVDPASTPACVTKLSVDPCEVRRS